MWASERLLALSMLAGSPMLAAAQAQPPVTEADIERARRTQPVITEHDMQKARERHRTPGDAELKAVPGTPRIDALPVPAAPPVIDLEALARGFDSPAGADALAARSEPSLLIFVSFAVPEPTLTRLVEQADRARASLVLRGMSHGSLKQTVARVQTLIGNRKVGVQIDPQAFDRYSVAQTPSFVLSRGGLARQACNGNACSPADDYVRVAGDVSLDYALAHVQRSAPSFARAAGVFRERLKHGSSR